METNIGRVLQNKEFGVAVVDVVITREGKRACDSAGFYARRVGDNSLRPEQVFGTPILTPGEYVAEAAWCITQLPQSNIRIEGPHAKFSIQAGELVDIGEFRLDYATQGIILREGIAHRSVHGLSPARLAKLHEQIPALLPQMTKRPMELIGAPEMRIKNKLF